MPAKLERCVQKVKQQRGVTEQRAWAICTAALKKSGALKTGHKQNMAEPRKKT